MHAPKPNILPPMRPLSRQQTYRALMLAHGSKSMIFNAARLWESQKLPDAFSGPYGEIVITASSGGLR